MLLFRLWDTTAKSWTKFTGLLPRFLLTVFVAEIMMLICNSQVQFCLTTSTDYVCSSLCSVHCIILSRAIVCGNLRLIDLNHFLTLRVHVRAEVWTLLSTRMCPVFKWLRGRSHSRRKKLKWAKSMLRHNNKGKRHVHGQVNQLTA